MLSDEYFASARNLLSELGTGSGTLISSGFLDNLTGKGYVLRQKEYKGFWRHWWLAPLFSIADHLCPDAMILFNESFASTNES
ncbi:MAG: hypothetical protein M0Q94_06155 [Candidatus Cloacimonetes bacterium]|nr:hypothetical protein [Candidatus Cloacimonadota bacterium]